MAGKNNVTLLQKIAITLVYILAAIGVVYLYDTFMHFTAEKGNQVFWAILFGVAYAYTTNYKWISNSEGNMNQR